MVGSRSCSHCCLYCHGVAWWTVFQRSIFWVREKNGCPEDKQEKKFSFDEGLWQLKDFFVSKRLPTSALLCTSNIDFHVCINVVFVAWCLGGVAFVAVLLWCIFGFDSLIPWFLDSLIPWFLDGKDLIVVEDHLLLQSLLPGRWLLVLTSFAIMLHWSVNSLVNKPPCSCLNC